MRSDNVTKGVERAPNRSLFYALGYTREELERAAEPFYTKSINGIGLGLAIVKKLTDQNGGFFQMESQPGEGTRVSLWFPAGEEETDEPDIDSRR